MPPLEPPLEPGEEIGVSGFRTPPREPGVFPSARAFRAAARPPLGQEYPFLFEPKPLEREVPRFGVRTFTEPIEQAARAFEQPEAPGPLPQRVGELALKGLGVAGSPFAVPFGVGGGLISAGLQEAQTPIGLARRLGIQPGDDVGQAIERTLAYERSRPEGERIVSQILTIIPFEQVFRLATLGASMLARAPAARAVGRTAAEAMASEAGAVSLGRESAAMRIRKFLEPKLESEYKTLQTALEKTGAQMDAVAGPRQDQWFVILERPPVRDLQPAKFLTEENIAALDALGASREATVGLLGFSRLPNQMTFKDFADLRQFLKTGEYKAPTILFPSQAGPVKPLFEAPAFRPPPKREVYRPYREKGMKTISREVDAREARMAALQKKYPDLVTEAEAPIPPPRPPPAAVPEAGAGPPFPAPAVTPRVEAPALGDDFTRLVVEGFQSRESGVKVTRLTDVRGNPLFEVEGSPIVLKRLEGEYQRRGIVVHKTGIGRRHRFEFPQAKAQAAMAAKIPAPAVKQPWQMTAAEFGERYKPIRNFQQYTPEQRAELVVSRGGYRQKEAIGEYFYTIEVLPDRAFETAGQAEKAVHRIVIERALSEGKSVPPEVLAEYPDLAARARAPSPAARVPAEAPAVAAAPRAAPAPAPRAAAKNPALLQALNSEAWQRVQRGGESTLGELVIDPKLRRMLQIDTEGAVANTRVRWNASLKPEIGAQYKVRGAPVSSEVTRARRVAGTPSGEIEIAAHTDPANLFHEAAHAARANLGRTFGVRGEWAERSQELGPHRLRQFLAEYKPPIAAPAPRAAVVPETAPAPAAGGVPPREPMPPTMAGAPPTTTAGAAPTPPPAGLPPIRPPTVGTTPAGVFRIPEVPAPAATLAELRTLHPERLRVKPEPLQSQANADAVVEALQVHRYAEEVGRNATAPIMAHLRAIGDDAALFGVDARGFATKVGNPNNLSLQVGDVMERIGRYTTTPKQQEYVRVMRSIYDAMLVEARKHGVTINEIPTPDEWFHYIGRRVVQKVPAPGQRAMPGVSRLGAKATQQKQRFYDLAEDAVVALEQKGAGYVLPSEALQTNIMATYKLIGDKQALDILKPITRLPTKQRPPVFGEVSLDMPGFRLYWDTGKGIATRLRYTDAPTARAIAKAFTPEQVPAALETARGLARLGVMFKATWDWSWSFIQGQLVLGHDLKNLVGAVARPGVAQPSAVWARSLYGGIRATLNPRHLEEFRVKHWDTYLERVREGGITGETEYFAAAGPLERAAAKVPVAGSVLGKVVKQTFGRFNTAFTTAREEAATLQYEGLRPAWVADGGSLRELSEWSDKTTGVVSPQMLGVSRTQAAAESAAAFASIWIRAQLMVTRDLFRGNRTAAQARENLAALAGGMTAGYVAISMALGQKPKLNPLPKRFGGDGGEFFTWEIQGEHIGPSIYALWMIKFLSEVTAMAVDEPERLLVVDDTNPAVRSAFTKASPLVNLQRELITGRDFLGRELVRAGKEFQDVARVLVEPLMPISLQDMLEEPPTAAGFAAEMLGWRAYPVSALDKLARVKTPGFEGSFYDLEPAQQRAIMGSPEGQRMMAEERLRPDFRKREEQRQELLREQRERNAGLVAGTLNGQPYNWRRWAKDRTRAQIKREGEVETWEILRPFVERPPKNDNDKALRGLYDLAKRFEGKGGRFDSVGYARARESYLDMLSVDDRDYIIRNVGPGRTAIERDVDALEEKAKAYYTIIDEQIGGDRELQRAYEEHQAADAQAQALMRRRNPELATLVKAIRDGRERLRQQNPNVDLFAHLFKGTKLMNRANLDAAQAGKLTFAGVPVPYTPSTPVYAPGVPRPPLPPQPPRPRAMPSMFALTPTAGGFPNERTRELFERTFQRP